MKREGNYRLGSNVCFLLERAVFVFVTCGMVRHGRAGLVYSVCRMSLHPGVNGADAHLGEEIPLYACCAATTLRHSFGAFTWAYTKACFKPSYAN